MIFKEIKTQKNKIYYPRTNRLFPLISKVLLNPINKSLKLIESNGDLYPYPNIILTTLPSFKVQILRFFPISCYALSVSAAKER